MSGIKYEVLAGDDLISALRGGRTGDLLDDAAYAAADEIESLRSRLSEADELHAKQLAETIERLNDDYRSRLAEAERDAVRYRWLRDRAWPFEFNGDTPADADAAIDAAMRPPAKKHTPRCSYWDGLFAQVCNCGAADNERA